MYRFILKTISVPLVSPAVSTHNRVCSNSLAFHINKWLPFIFNMFTYLISPPICNQHPSLLPAAAPQAPAPHTSALFSLLSLSLPLLGI